MARTINFEIAKARSFWFKKARERGWDDDIRDHGWKAVGKKYKGCADEARQSAKA